MQLFSPIRIRIILAGLDDIKAFNFFTKKPMKVYADSLTEEALRRDFYYAFADTKYPGIPELEFEYDHT